MAGSCESWAGAKLRTVTGYNSLELNHQRLGKLMYSVMGTVHLYSTGCNEVTPALTLASTERNVQIGDQITSETIAAQTKSS